MKINTHKAAKAPVFVLWAERAMCRAAKNVRLHGIAEEEALKKGMEEKSKEVVEKGAKVHEKE